MARPVNRLLPLLLAACLLLLQASGCSSSASSPAEEPPKPAGGAVHDDALHHHHLLHAEARTARAASEVAADDGRNSTVADDGQAPSTETTTPAAMAEGLVAWRPQQQTTSGRAPVGAGLGPAVLLRSKLARRLLAGVDVDDAGTDGAGPSCHSSNVHINCPPASSKP